MFRPVLLVALVAVVSATSPPTVYPTYKLQKAIYGLGLPSFYSPKYSLRGLEGYLQQAKVAPALFVTRIQKYKPAIRRVLLPLRKQYRGVLGDLVQISVLRYYGCQPVINPKISFATYFRKYIRKNKIPSSSRYNDKYVLSFLNGFKGYLRKYKSPKYVIPIVVPKPSYPGYELLATLKSIGLPALSYPKKSLGGIVAYLKVAKISKAKFVLRIKRYRSAILRLVLKYRKQYSGYRADLLQLACLRYYGIKKSYSVKFSAAFKRALSRRSKYSKRYVRSFLVRFSKYLVKPVYPGYKLKALLVSVGLPKLYKPQYSLSGLVTYLRSNKYTQAALVKRIRKYAPKIKKTVYRYRKQYSGYRSDLLQLCAIRYYSMPKIIRKNVRFGYTFQRYISSQKLKLYNAYYVNKFLNGFIKYIRKYQLKKYSGVLWRH